MPIEDFKIGDRVIRVDFGEVATIINIENGLYVLHFDNPKYFDLVCDGEKLMLVGEDNE